MFSWLSGVAQGRAFGRHEFASRSPFFFGLDIMKVMYYFFIHSFFWRSSKVLTFNLKKYQALSVSVYQSKNISLPQYSVTR